MIAAPDGEIKLATISGERGTAIEADRRAT